MSARFVNEEAARRSGERIAFSFGENWQKYLASLTETRIEQACASLVKSFGGAPLAGRSFLDIGCGTGLFSLCAIRLGAASVVSVDVDPLSIACAEALRERSGRARDWTIVRGSILDPDFVRRLAPASRVYSWGVLHHTGAMWAAFDHALTRLESGGLACIALYNRPHFPAVQMRLKRLYNALPSGLRPGLAVAYAGVYLGAVAATGRSPVRYVREYGKRERGMSFWRDVEDWLGGLPYEFAEEPAVRRFVAERGLVLERVERRRAGGNNEYLIRRVG